jgi:hypothetical protein
MSIMCKGRISCGLMRTSTLDGQKLCNADLND